MGVLAWFDRGNQRVVDHLRADPTAGTRLFPFARSPRERRIALLLVSAVVVAGLLFGLIGSIVIAALVSPVLWRLQHHVFVGRRSP